MYIINYGTDKSRVSTEQVPYSSNIYLEIFNQDLLISRGRCRGSNRRFFIDIINLPNSYVHLSIDKYINIYFI